VGAVAVIKLASVLDWIVVAAASFALMLARLRGRLGAAPFVALAMVLVAVDLFKAGMGYNPAIRTSTAVPPATPAIRFLQSERPARFGVLKATAPIALAYPIPPNVAMHYHLYDVRGYVIPTEKRYFELWSRVISPGCYYLFCTQSAPAEPRALRALGLLGVTSLLQNRGDPPLRSLETAYSGRDARIYRNPAALPRAFLVNGQQVVRNAAAARTTVTDPGFPARKVAVTERRIPGLSESSSKHGRSPGRARIVDYESERVVVETDAARSALLVLTDNWFPGWTAAVDGRDEPIERVDYLLRGVSVPAGAHRVEFRYEPTAWRVGWIVSLAALLAILAAAIFGWRRRAGGRAH
jgi:hypothetical protein